MFYNSTIKKNGKRNYYFIFLCIFVAVLLNVRFLECNQVLKLIKMRAIIVFGKSYGTLNGVVTLNSTIRKIVAEKLKLNKAKLL